MCNYSPEIFEIPEWNLPVLHTKIKKLNTRAKKLSVPELRVVEHGTKQKIHPAVAERVELGVITRQEAPKYNVHLIAIEGAEIKLAGWKFVGTLDHYTLPGKVIVNAVPGQSVPEQFHDSDAKCAHCGKIRRRIETFIVEHENGELKQVGRNCLKDFLGHDPARMIRFLQTIRQMFADLENEDSDYYGMGGGAGFFTYSHIDSLARTCAVVRTYGWVSRSKAKFEETINATADDVIETYHPPKSSRELDHWKQWMAKIKWNKENDEAEAKAAIEWLAEQPSNNEYLHNLHAIAEAEEVPQKLMGYWCSLIATYQKAMDRLREAALQRKVSEWVGEVKKRQEFVVTVQSINYLDSYYGAVDLHRMIDDNGRTLVWFANTDSGMEKGHTYKIVGTVKKHDKYNGWKQTNLNRVKVIEEITDEEAA